MVVAILGDFTVFHGAFDGAVRFFYMQASAELAFGALFADFQKCLP